MSCNFDEQRKKTKQGNNRNDMGAISYFAPNVKTLFYDHFLETSMELIIQKYL